MKRLRFLISMLLCIAMLFSAAACNTDTSDVYKLNKTSITLEVGQTEKLSVSDDAGNAVSAVFSSDDEAVATVAEDGTVTAVKAGTATITAKVNDSTSLTCSVTVTGEPAPIEYDYALNYSSLTMREGEQKQLFVNVSPEKQITPEWSVEDDTVASISVNGTVSALKEGKTTITAKVDGKTLTCEVTVQAEYIYTLDCTKLTIQEKSTRQLNILTAPALEDGDTLPAFDWDSTDDEVVTVSDTGLLTAVGAGDATVTATYGSIVLACEVTVAEIEYSYILNMTSLNLKEGDEETLSVISYPAQDNLSVEWTTSAASVATVENGVVTAVGGGYAVITATVDGQKLTCAVNVEYTDPKVTATSTVTNIEDSSVNLTDADATGALDTLYWEKYQGGQVITQTDATDLITPNKDLTVNNPTSSGFEGFDDYRASISWSDGKPTLSGTNNTQGVCVRAELRFTIDVDPSVKEIRIYTGAWRGTNTTKLLLGTTELAASAEFSADDTSVGRMITYKLDVEAERTLTLVIEPTDTYNNGNCSLVAIAVLGTEISYSLSNNVLNLTKDETAQLSVSCTVPETEFTVSYESSAPTIASVDSEGLVTARAQGTAVITATVNGSEQLTCTINVTEIPVSYEYTLSETELTLDLNTSHQLSVSVTPAKDIAVVWSTSKDSVATVTQDGTVKAVGSGMAIITAAVDDQELNCTVTVPELAVIASAASVDIAGQSFNLDDLSESYGVLYWEHYQSGRIDSKHSADDIVSTESTLTDSATFGGFDNYKATLSWYAGNEIAAYYQNPNGICIRQNVTIDISVNESVKEIRLFTGAWNGTNNTKLLIGDVQIAMSDSFTAGGDSQVKMITYSVDVKESTTVTLQLAPTDMHDGGNMSLVAIAVLGDATAAQEATTSVSLKGSTAMTSNTNVYNLTEIGTIDWFATYHNGGPDEKKDGTAFVSDSFAYGSNTPFWDYAAAFTWTDGTTCASDPNETNVSGDSQKIETGTNNGRCGAYVNIDVTVPAGKTELVLWAGGWQSTYFVEIIDSNGNILFNELIAEKTSGNRPFMVELSIDSEEGETLTAVVYCTDKNGGGNCSLAAIALRNPVSVDPENPQYNLNKTELTMTVGDNEQLSVTVTPEQEFTPVWSVEDDAIVSVEDGLVTALKAGSTKVYATIGEVILTCNVTVSDPLPTYEYTLSDTEITLTQGETDQLTVSVTPDKEDMTVIWSTNNGLVATVSQDGTVKAVGAGSAIITAAVDGQELNCTVTVNAADLAVTASATVADAEGLNVNLTDIDETLDTLYWEHYHGGGADAMLNANDRIVPDRDICADGAWTFSDYKANISWSNGTNTPAYSNNRNGICLDTETSFQITVDSSVKQIRIYAGAWNATGSTRLMLGDMVLAASESFTAEGNSIARVITYTIDTDSEQTLTLVITPSGMPEGNRTGNTSLVAIALLGVSAETATTSLSMSKTEMTGYNDCHVDLTEKGTRDWFYLNYDKISDTMNGGDDSILTDTLNVQSNGVFWDYKAAFKWTNGTTYEESPIDNDCNEQGTNNGLCGAYCAIDVKVDAETKHIYMWVGGYDNAEYYLEAVDQNGNVVFNELVGISGSGETVAYELDLAVTASASETLSLILYRTAGNNCSLAAIAVA